MARPAAGPRAGDGGGRHALLVSSGILLSRVTGFARTYVFSHYFGLRSGPADAFNAALAIPNLLQNLFGEGVLSASFIPVYARLLAEGEEIEAGRVAGAIAAILSLTVSVLVLVGVLATPIFIDLITPGFHGAERELTIRLVRILFPATGLLALSAWCLGVLNSHRRFFLSYSAPVAMNAVSIAALLFYGNRLGESDLAVKLAWASVAGSALMIVAMLPTVLRVARHLRIAWETSSANVREVIRNFVPVFFGRGVVQISAYVDRIFATYLGTGAVTGLFYGTQLYALPVSLFGMAVSAAELPAMSSALGGKEDVAAFLRQRIGTGLRRLAFFVIPSAMALLALGNVVAGVVFQTGAFQRRDSNTVWAIVAGSAVGLLASTMGRLYSSTFYALRDTRTPLYFAMVRVALTAALGYICAFRLPPALGLEPRFWVAGLTASAGVAGWVEFTLLRRALNRRIGATGLPAVLVAKLWLAAAIGAAGAWGVRLAIGLGRPLVFGCVILAAYGATYLGATLALRVEESSAMIHQVRRRVGL